MGHVGVYYKANGSCVECLRERSRRYEANNPVMRPWKRLQRALVQHESKKTAIVNMYTNGEATCRKCGQGDMDVLCVDHISHGGTKHRKEIGAFNNSSSFYCWIIKNDYPPGFQILCANCNIKKEVERRRARKMDFETYRARIMSRREGRSAVGY